MMTSYILTPKRDRKAKFFLCEICLSNWPENKGVTLEQCKCTFCKECVQCYLKHAVDAGNILSIECPDGKCSVKKTIPEHQISTLMDENAFQRYKKIKKTKEVAIDRTKVFCPSPGCEGICSGIPGVPQQSVCKECGLHFCFLCKEPWHEDKACKDIIDNAMDIKSGLRIIDILRKGGSSDIKQCPLCSILIQRDAGCAQMMCGNCRHMFCWHCRQSLDNDLLLRHYDKGPCRNKLGHSRATLYLHRTQVVAGFVFFGAMIVVASPFLLIISPCLLISKICSKDEET